LQGEREGWGREREGQRERRWEKEKDRDLEKVLSYHQAGPPLMSTNGPARIHIHTHTYIYTHAHKALHSSVGLAQ
jgi:hypothetical protein